MYITEWLNKLIGTNKGVRLGDRIERIIDCVTDLRARQVENKTYLDAEKVAINSSNLLLSDMSTRHSEIKTLADNIKTWLGQVDEYMNYNVLNAAGLAQCGGTAAEIEIFNRTDFTCGNPSLVYSLPVNSNIAFTATTHDIATGASIRERVYVVEATANSTIVLNAGDATSGAGNAEYPAAVSTRTQIAAVRISIDASAGTIFDATTTTLGASQINAVTYYDLTGGRSIGAVPSDTITALTDSVPTDVSATSTAVSVSAPSSIEMEPDYDTL